MALSAVLCAAKPWRVHVMQDTAPDPLAEFRRVNMQGTLNLARQAAATGMEVVIIRRPLVYGPGAPGNFGSLIRWLQRGASLPLGAT